MKLINTKGLYLFFFLFLQLPSIYAQIWSEDFGTGCVAEELANGFVTAQGTWTTVDLNNNGTAPNQWYISAKSSGVLSGNCSNSCDIDPSLDNKTLHIGKNTSTGLYDGATFLSGVNNITSVLVESPSIDLSGECGMALTFDYFLGGTELAPITPNNVSVLVLDDQDTTILNPLSQSSICPTSGLKYIEYQVTLPEFVNNNPDVRIGFIWENDETAVAYDDLSFAVHNISIVNLPPLPPALTCLSDTTVYVNTSCDYSLGDFTAVVNASDICTAPNDLIITQSIPSGTNYSVDQFNLEIEVENDDALTNSCIISIDVVDTITPIITTCPNNQSLSFDANCEASMPDYKNLVVATDNCSTIDLTSITQTPSPGTSLSGDTPITMEVTDDYGNTRSCQFDLSVSDDTSPSITCPSSIQVYSDLGCDAILEDASELFTGADNCTDFEDLTFNQTPAPGTNLNTIDEMEVFYTDENGNNSTTCIVPIEVLDTVPPSIICPGSQNQNIGLNCEYEVPDFTAIAQIVENCTSVTTTQTPAVGSFIGAGQNTITISASDVDGNTNQCVFTLNAVEPVEPTINCPDDIYTCDPVVVYDDPIVDDNCEVADLIQTDNTGLTSGDTFPIGVTNQTYEVVDESGNTKSCTFKVNVALPSNLAEIITEDLELCDVASIFLQAETPITGSGEWSVIQGAADFNNELASETGANGLADGENVFVWTVTSADCGVSTDTLTVTLYRSPIPASTAGNQFVCSDTTTIVPIAANAPSVGEGIWFTIDPNVSIADPNTPATSVSVSSLNPGWNHMVWQITNGTCPATQDTLGIFYGAVTTLLSEDTTLCLEENELVLDGGSPPDEIMNNWFFTRGAGIFENSTAASTLVYDLQGGSNLIVLEQRSDFCPTIQDTLEVTIELCSPYDPNLPTVFTPNGDGRNDLFIVEQLHALYPNTDVSIVNRWGNVVFESNGYLEPWNGKRMNTGEDLPMGTYFYRIRINDEAGQELTGPISIVR